MECVLSPPCIDMVLEVISYSCIFLIHISNCLSFYARPAILFSPAVHAYHIVAPAFSVGQSRHIRSSRYSRPPVHCGISHVAHARESIVYSISFLIPGTRHMPRDATLISGRCFLSGHTIATQYHLQSTTHQLLVFTTNHPAE